MNIKYLERQKIEDIRKTLINSKIFIKEKREFKKKVNHFVANEAIKFISLFLLISFLVLNLGTSVNAPIFLSSFSSKEAIALYDEEKVKLEKELEEIEKEIAAYEKVVAQTQKEKITLQNKIKELKNKAEQLTLKIKQTNINLDYLKIRIEDTTNSINQTISKIEKTKENLKNTLLSFYHLKQYSTLEIILANNEISEFFDYLNAVNLLQEKIQANIQELEELEDTLSQQKQKLDADVEETQKMLAMQLLQKQDLDKNQKENATLLEVTKGNEEKYQQLLSSSRQKANEIRQRLYELIGVKTQVTFGEALDIAEWVSSKTGIRPAFLLAVITQESNLGKNVGTCNRPGDPYNKSWRQVMKPSQHEAFLKITSELGLDPDTTPVSCPINDPKRGLIAGKNSWGGAMGPAQFIPTTWLTYAPKVKQITGKAVANPWDVRDSFLAAALYLTNYGANKKTRDSEWRAALIYFSGSVNTKYSFYADSVLAIADRYESDIATLNQVASR